MVSPCCAWWDRPVLAALALALRSKQDTLEHVSVQGVQTRPGHSKGVQVEMININTQRSKHTRAYREHQPHPQRNICERQNKQSPLKHIANTAALSNYVFDTHRRRHRWCRTRDCRHHMRGDSWRAIRRYGIPHRSAVFVLLLETIFGQKAEPQHRDLPSIANLENIQFLLICSGVTHVREI